MSRVNIVFLDEVFGGGLEYTRWAETCDTHEVRWTAPHPQDEAAAIKAVADATVIIASFFPVTAAVLEAAPHCRIILAQGTGYDHIDVDAANTQGIPVSNAPGWCTEEVAEHTVASLLAIARGYPTAHDALMKGEWNRDIGNQLHRVKGSTLGLIGCGRTARSVHRRVTSLGVRVVAHDPFVAPDDMPLGMQCVSLQELCQQSDYISLHVPLTPDTKHFVNDQFLARLRPGTLLVNTSRGGVLDDSALCRALEKGIIARAALDVFEQEPLPQDSPLRKTDRILLSPHLAGTSAEAFIKGQEMAIGEIVLALENKPLQNQVPSSSVRIRTVSTASVDDVSNAVDTSSSKQDKERPQLQLPENPTMRDIFDACTIYKMYNVAAGMIEVPPPPLLLAQMARTSQQTDIHMYRARFGDPVYIDGVLHLLTTRYGVPHANKDNIMACAGVTGIIVSTLLMTRAAGGTRIGLLEPFYTYHYKQVDAVFGGVASPILLPYQADTFRPDLDLIEQQLSSESGLDLIIICNPGNPVGLLWSRADLQRLVQLTKQYHCTLLIDEIYVDFVWDSDFYSPITDAIEDHVIVARGFSKNLCVGSWRLAYAITGPATVKRLMAEHDRLFISTSVLQQTLGTYLTDHIEDALNHLNYVRDTVHSNYKRLTRAFEQAFGWKTLSTTGSLYAWIKHTCDTDRHALEAVLAKGVGVCPGAIFYRDEIKESGYIRIQLGFDEAKAKQIEAALLSE